MTDNVYDKLIANLDDVQAAMVGGIARIQALEAENAALVEALALAAKRLTWCAGIIPNDNARDLAGTFGDEARAALSAIPSPAPVTVAVAAKVLSPDQLIEALSVRISETDPDVEPWALRWCDKVAEALNEGITTKGVADDLRALTSGESDDA